MAKDVWVRESPIDVVEGEVKYYEHEWEFGTTLATPTAKVYRNGRDVTSTIMSGADEHSITGRVQTLKAMFGFKASNVYVVAIQCVIDGETLIRKLQLNCQAPGQVQA